MGWKVWDKDVPPAPDPDPSPVYGPPRYYRDDQDGLFAVSAGGAYFRWDGLAWIHVTGPLRDFYSRKIEGGDALPVDAPKGA